MRNNLGLPIPGVPGGRGDGAAAQVWSDGCHKVDDVLASEARVLVLATCDGGNKNVETLLAVDPHSGAVEWSVAPPESGQLVLFALLSADPPVLANHVADFNCCHRQRYLVYGGDGESRTTIERGDGSELAAGLSKHWFSRENTTSFAVVDSTLVTGTWPDGTSGLDERQLAGFDLDTGEELWRTRLPDGVSPNIVEPVNGGPVRLFDTAGFRLFDLDVNTGKTTQAATLTNPFDFPDQFEVDFFPLAVGNMLVLCPHLAQYATDATTYRLAR